MDPERVRVRDMPGMLRPIDVARRLRCAKSTVCVWLRDGKLEGKRIAGEFSDWAIPEAALEDFIEQSLKLG